MALTRAQLLAGNSAQGTVLPGEVQGVKQSAGTTIAADGSISVNSQTIVGVMKLGQTAAEAAAAYNSYDFPNATGTVGQQLTITNVTGTATTLEWGDPDQIPWTAKGQLVVGTGAGTETILNVGANTSLLVADSNVASGLAYSNALKSAILLPVGNNTTERPATPAVGQIRYNNTSNEFEGYGGAVPAWSAIGAPPAAGLGINITGSLVKVSIPTASTPPAAGAGAAQAVVGSMYWDDTLNQLFIYYNNGGTPVWVQAAPSASGGASVTLGLGLALNGANTAFKMPVASAPPAINTTATGAFDGSMYWDDTLGQLFIRYNNAGTPTWVPAAPPAGGVPAASSAEAAAGLITTKYSSPATAVAKDAANTTGAALLPSGTNAQRAAIATPVAGMTRFNTSYSPKSLEAYDGTDWNQVAYVPDLGTLTDLIPTNGSTLPAAGTYENIIINAGVTVNVPSTCSLTARTSIQINGTINANGVGNIGGAGAIASNSSSDGGKLGQGLGVLSDLYGFATSFVGSGGLSGGVFAGAATNVVGGIGGRSGGTVILSCQGPITLGASASISANGANGATGITSGANYGLGGAGGGSGGLIILQSYTSLSTTAGSTLSVQGGSAANAVVAGTVLQSGGGGGGGGGYIVLNSPSTADASTKNVSGGLGGLTVVSGAIVAGGRGAGFGGTGGSGSASAANGSAGSLGQVILNAYI